jgi:predicted 3-demethylubiquinone-9 3-methyltransferase (glyoxalase superfamily)
MQKITPFLWFDTQAEEAARFYVSIFNNSRIVKTVRYGEAGPGPAGSVMTVAFELNGVPFTALNGGPLFDFSEAVSFVVNCQSQAEVDSLWQKLSAGGRPGRCGWLKDKYGLSWQIDSRALHEMITSPDQEGAARATRAMLGMKKLDIQALQDAFDGQGVIVN